MLTRIDRNALTRYCRLWSRWKSAELSLDKHGSIYELMDDKGHFRCVQQRPEVAIAHRLALALVRLEAEFGMTPASRTRIEADVPASREPEGKDKFFRCVG